MADATKLQAPSSRTGGTMGSPIRRIALLIVIGIVLFVGVSALYLRARLDPGDVVAGVSDVVVRDDEFAPGAIEVPVGTTVTWRWEGLEEHNVVGDEFESPTQSDGEFAHAFMEPGTHSYECTLHFFMRGKVVVSE